MSTSYLSNNNYESLHSDELQRQHAAEQATSVSRAPQPTKVITDVAQLENNDPALTSRVAAAVLGIAPGTFSKMRQRKQGPNYYKTETGTIRYLLSEVLAYRARRTVKH
jgi:predicted DNA-binding transcriptional regulator AlpA